jgi:hypothetical protein
MSDRFTLKDSKGKTYTALRIPGQKIETTTLSSTRREFIEGMPSYRLADGRALNHRADNDTFEIVQTGEILKRV